MPRSTHKLRMPVRQLGLLFGHLADKLSRALFQDAPYIFFSRAERRQPEVGTSLAVTQRCSWGSGSASRNAANGL